jgi:hypothetical protein
MKTSPLPGPTARANDRLTDPPITLRDIVQALCSGMAAHGQGIELVLDRIERAS